MFNRQIEMSFAQAGRGKSARARQTRAQWWFSRMRQIVDRTIVWQPVPQPRPIQIWFPVADNRRTEVPVLQASAKSNGPLDKAGIASDCRN